jgi:CheY-like chemotaxis protein
LSSQVVILDEVLAAGESFLRRAIGETITFRLASTIDAWACRVDPAQFEAAILNLAVNARDAMPDGGSLTISTANVTIDEAASLLADMPATGAYVCVEVRDTGRGMDEETARRAFEPFFTTKDVGKGTGLGLSQVYGFVTQSGGYVSLQSEIDAGSTFRIYLHRVHQDPVKVRAEDDAIGDVPTGSETILVVEDNQAVLELAIMTIGDLGYHVLSAANGAEALKIMGNDVPVDLLFSDVVMPGGINGFELVRRAREMRHGLKALITSGYADTANDDQVPPLPVLTKPYARGDLARRLRQVLDV